MEKKDDKQYVDFVVTARKYKTLLTDKYRNRPFWNKTQPGEIFSALPGTIIEVVAHEGQDVSEGDLLLVLEAMKMQNRIIAPVAGVVREIFVKEGDKIGKHCLMMKIG
ncbi:MAG: acetyl-CoA carboxylase biotin carboxyl carrier protein subunit [Tannerellaceae bacterium]|jgi:pyruvate carboxylase subunit B|nr:acetyl-CoA carboxylase biotin carboxyl carrier protein subunit [Tannerellaceae bacterium]